MAPKPAKTPAADAVISMSYKDYMESQNEVVNAVNEHYNVASNIMMASSRSMQTLVAAMLHVRKSAKAALGESPEGLDQFPALAGLLSKEQSELYNPMALGLGSLLSPTEPPTDVGSKTKMKKMRKLKDPNAPKRPQTAYFLYLDTNRDSLKGEKGDGQKPGDIAKELATRWKVLPESEREIYKAQYRANYEEYKVELEEYKANGGKVDDEEDVPPVDDDVVVDGAKEASVSSASDDSEAEETAEEKEPTPAPPPPKATPAKGKKTKAALAKEAVAAAASAAAAAAAKLDPRTSSPEKPKSPEKKKGKAAEAKTPAATTPAESKKRKGDKEDSPEDSKKKKRKSTGGELEEKKKKRKDAHGDDY